LESSDILVSCVGRMTTASATSQELGRVLATPHNFDGDVKMTYDMVFNLSRLEEVLKKDQGWTLKVKDADTWKKLQTDGRIKVGIMGVYNRGKTFVTQLLKASEKECLRPELSSGNLIHTEGLSAILTEGFMFMDTAGQNQSLLLKRLDLEEKTDEHIYNSRVISDLFCSDMVVHLSNILLVVVNQLTLEDQRYVRVLEKIVNEEASMDMMVIHNLKDVRETCQLEKLIKKDIIHGFDCKELTWLDKHKYWMSQSGVPHAVLAHAPSPAGNSINSNTVTFLKQWMEGKRTKKPQTKTILQTINSYMQENLHKYFTGMTPETKLYGEFVENHVKIFMDTKEHELKKNAMITEWQIIWGAKYTLDWDMLSWKDKKLKKQGVIVRVDLPGVFKHKPRKPKQFEKDIFTHVYGWTEPGMTTECLRLTVNLARKGEAGTSVEVVATRPKVAQEDTAVVYQSGKHGKVSLLIELEKQGDKAFQQKKICDGFDQAEVHMQDNGVLTVVLTTAGKYEEAKGTGCWCGVMMWGSAKT